MVLECTDCKHCAVFHAGYRIFCLHPDLPPDEVLNYSPLKPGTDAFYNCDGFSEHTPYFFSWDHLREAERYSEKKYGVVSYGGVREWCEREIQRRINKARRRAMRYNGP